MQTTQTALTPLSAEHELAVLKARLAELEARSPAPLSADERAEIQAEMQREMTEQAIAKTYGPPKQKGDPLDGTRIDRGPHYTSTIVTRTIPPDLNYGWYAD